MNPQIVDGVLYGADELVGRWVQDHLGGGEIAGPYTALGVVGAGGELVFGALFFNHRDDDIEVALYASDIRPAMPRTIRRILDYPFKTLGCARFSAEIEANNARSIRFCLGLGMKLEGVKRRACNGQDKLIFGLLPEDCPFLRETHGKSPESAAAH